MTTTPTEPRPAMPPAVRRLLWWMVLPLAFITAGAVFYKLPAMQSAIATPSHWWPISIFLFTFAPLFVAIFAISRGQRRIKRAVLAAHGRSCINCVHDLNGLGDTGACPECGHAFHADADARRWERVNMQ